ncbi:hypothetical protein T09_5261 [Trichinella sp. T9]|nr:hypothetical protein T09_5261 [Trichinella sp. T9]
MKPRQGSDQGSNWNMLQRKHRRQSIPLSSCRKFQVQTSPPRL